MGSETTIAYGAKGTVIEFSEQIGVGSDGNRKRYVPCVGKHTGAYL